MQLTSKENIEVPIDQVFEMLTDFERHERSAMRRGAEVARTDTLSKPGVGVGWDVGFEFRGKPRQVHLEVIEFDRPYELALKAEMQGLDSIINLQLVALSKTLTRLNVVTDIKPKTLSARLLVQSMKLAKSNITKRFDSRMAAQARDMENRFNRIA
ncbi:SRPBCC family protein [uncultured Shimia sp.]|uniref:SRPBCC family protein n=1 Tax=uncultured Shimia sp. TaxID=573152 RepID=UPI00260209A9|nr:SRPBCC family protein [uncultured Shimia sp.]